MADKPILFSVPMVRALRAHRKAEDRRLFDGSLRFMAGDRLWVRERFLRTRSGEVLFPDTFPNSADIPRGFEIRSPVFLSRRDSRITLLVTAVRVEYLQRLSEDDARLEGVVVTTVDREAHTMPHREAYKQHWERLHGSGSWQANPQVLVIRFATQLKNIDKLKG